MVYHKSTAESPEHFTCARVVQSSSTPLWAVSELKVLLWETDAGAIFVLKALSSVDGNLVSFSSYKIVIVDHIVAMNIEY